MTVKVQHMTRAGRGKPRGPRDSLGAGQGSRCAVPECRGISHADAAFREALWDRFFTAAPRPRTPSELLYSDRRLRSKSSPAATILTENGDEVAQARLPP